MALLYYPLFIEEFEQPKTLALVSFACFAVFYIDWKRAFKDRVTQCLLALTASAALSTVTSVDWHMSVFGNSKCPMGLLVIASYLVLYCSINQSIRSRFDRSKMIDIIICLSAFISLYAIAQVLGFDFKEWNGTLKTEGYTRPMSTLGHPNFMANYLAMTLPFVMWKIDNAESKATYWLFWALFIASVAAIFFSQSRGMAISAFVAMVSYFYLSKAKLKSALKLFLAAVLVILASASLSDGLRKTAINRFEAVVSPGPARKEYLKGALRIWKKAPILGVGTDAFELGFQHQRTPYYWEIESRGSPHKAHNDFLNILATQGIVGAICAILLTLAVFRMAKKSDSALRVPLISSIIAFYVAGLTSFVVVATGSLFLLYVSLLKESR